MISKNTTSLDLVKIYCGRVTVSNETANWLLEKCQRLFGEHVAFPLTHVRNHN